MAGVRRRLRFDFRIVDYVNRESVNGLVGRHSFRYGDLGYGDLA